MQQQQKHPEDIKSQKYDRQLRLWGNHGQKSLIDSNLCLINSNAIGTEVLKSLILPGLGRFNIIDHKLVTPQDIGNNFFLTEEWLGKSRAAATTQLLNELNPLDSIGSFNNTMATKLIDANIDYFKQFSIIIIAGYLNLKSFDKLSLFCYKNSIPLVWVSMIGFHGLVKISFQSHMVIESHEPTRPDLRISQPWPELAQFVESIDFDNLSASEWSEIPWLVLLVHLLTAWRKANGKSLTAIPSTIQDKKQLSAMFTLLEESIPTPVTESAIPDDFKENFHQARSKLFLCWQNPVFPSHFNSLFANLVNPISKNSKKIVPTSVPTNTSSTNLFTKCISALQVFFQNNKCLPISGVLPDMEASSEKYFALTEIFRQKAQKDYDEFLVGFSPDVELASFEKEFIARFVKNVQTISFMESQRLSLYSSSTQPQFQQLLSQAFIPSLSSVDQQQQQQDPSLLYLFILSCHHFYQNYNRFPGQGPDPTPEDKIHSKTCIPPSIDFITSESEKLVDILCSLSEVGKLNHDSPPVLTSVNNSSSEAKKKLPDRKVLEEIASHFVRCGGSHYHPTAAIIGAAAAQECIKLMTHQWIPTNNTFILDCRSMNGSNISTL